MEEDLENVTVSEPPIPSRSSIPACLEVSGEVKQHGKFPLTVTYTIKVGLVVATLTYKDNIYHGVLIQECGEKGIPAWKTDNQNPIGPGSTEIIAVKNTVIPAPDIEDKPIRTSLMLDTNGPRRQNLRRTIRMQRRGRRAKHVPTLCDRCKCDCGTINNKEREAAGASYFGSLCESRRITRQVTKLWYNKLGNVNGTKEASPKSKPLHVTSPDNSLSRKNDTQSGRMGQVVRLGNIRSDTVSSIDAKNVNEDSPDSFSSVNNDSEESDVNIESPQKRKGRPRKKLLPKTKVSPTDLNIVSAVETETKASASLPTVKDSIPTSSSSVPYLTSTGHDGMKEATQFSNTSFLSNISEDSLDLYDFDLIVSNETALAAMNTFGGSSNTFQVDVKDDEIVLTDADDTLEQASGSSNLPPESVITGSSIINNVTPLSPIHSVECASYSSDNCTDNELISNSIIDSEDPAKVCDTNSLNIPEENILMKETCNSPLTSPETLKLIDTSTQYRIKGLVIPITNPSVEFQDKATSEDTTDVEFLNVITARENSVAPPSTFKTYSIASKNSQLDSTLLFIPIVDVNDALETHDSSNDETNSPSLMDLTQSNSTQSEERYTGDDELVFSATLSTDDAPEIVRLCDNDNGLLNIQQEHILMNDFGDSLLEVVTAISTFIPDTSKVITDSNITKDEPEISDVGKDEVNLVVPSDEHTLAAMRAHSDLCKFDLKVLSPSLSAVDTASPKFTIRTVSNTDMIKDSSWISPIYSDDEIVCVYDSYTNHQFDFKTKLSSSDSLKSCCIDSSNPETDDDLISKECVSLPSEAKDFLDLDTSTPNPTGGSEVLENNLTKPIDEAEIKHDVPNLNVDSLLSAPPNTHEKDKDLFSAEISPDNSQIKTPQIIIKFGSRGEKKETVRIAPKPTLANNIRKRIHPPPIDELEEEHLNNLKPKLKKVKQQSDFNCKEISSKFKVTRNKNQNGREKLVLTKISTTEFPTHDQECMDKQELEILEDPKVTIASDVQNNVTNNVYSDSSNLYLSKSTTHLHRSSGNNSIEGKEEEKPLKYKIRRKCLQSFKKSNTGTGAEPRFAYSYIPQSN